MSSTKCHRCLLIPRFELVNAKNDWLCINCTSEINTVEVIDSNGEKFKKYKGKCPICETSTLLCNGYMSYGAALFNASNWGPMCKECRGYRYAEGKNLNAKDEKQEIANRANHKNNIAEDVDLFIDMDD